MKTTLFVAMVSAALATACVAAPGPKPAPGAAQPPAKAVKPQRQLTHAEILTKRIRDDEAKLRTEKDPAERDRLTNDIETTKHMLGPRDATGARLQFAAMWHDAAIESLDTEYKRLVGRAKAGGAGATTMTAALEARANLRRMASVCLLRGWTWGGTLPKYQFDAYGSYLANNLPTLDAVFDAITAALAKEATLPPAAPDREAFLAALAQAKDGCAKMSQAAETFAAPPETGKPAKDRDALVAALGTFHQGLETVCEADAALRELAGKQPKSDASAPAPAQEEHPSADEKAAIEKIRTAVAALVKDFPWEKIRDTLDRLSAVAEQGLATERTRPSAQELLHSLALVADYVQGLTKSKSAYPEYIAARQEYLTEAFSYLSQKGQRQYAYSRLRRICDGDRDRRAIDASPLGSDAAQGLLKAVNMTGAAFKAAGGGASYDAFDTARSRLIDTLAKSADWPPKAMSPQLAPAYKRFHDVFIRATEAAATAKADGSAAFLEAYQAAATFGKDLERIVVADQAVRAIEQYAPQHAASVCAEFLNRADFLAGSLTNAAAAQRPLVDEFLRPLVTLADLQLPGPAHQQIAQTLSGGMYKNALAMLGKQVSAALADAARGRSIALETALEARWMFKALRHRCVTETDGLAKTGVANLDAFSVPEKVYGPFVAALDQNVRRVMGRYVAEHIVGATPPGQFLTQWDTVYCYVGTAQRQTLKTRRPGQGDLDFLLRNLAQAADPSPADAAWFAWAVGFHCVEAATCLAAGYDKTAAYHLGLIKEHRADNHLDKELLPTAFDPK
jgi:cell division septum initiation protein DivIVA